MAAELPPMTNWVRVWWAFMGVLPGLGIGGVSDGFNLASTFQTYKYLRARNFLPFAEGLPSGR